MGLQYVVMVGENCWLGFQTHLTPVVVDMMLPVGFQIRRKHRIHNSLLLPQWPQNTRRKFRYSCFLFRFWNQHDDHKVDKSYCCLLRTKSAGRFHFKFSHELLAESPVAPQAICWLSWCDSRVHPVEKGAFFSLLFCLLINMSDETLYYGVKDRGDLVVKANYPQTSTKTWWSLL